MKKCLKRKIENCTYAYEVTALLKRAILKDPQFLGCEVETYPPMGLTASCAISIKKEKECIGFLNIGYYEEDKKGSFSYQSDDVHNAYPKGSIGDMNGFNSIWKKLPTSVEEVIKLITAKKKQEKNKYIFGLN